MAHDHAIAAHDGADTHVIRQFQFDELTPDNTGGPEIAVNHEAVQNSVSGKCC